MSSPARFTLRPPARRSRRRIVASLGLAAALVAGSAAAASAHVHVDADTTTSGSFSELALRVPNESPTAGTVKVSVELPADKPFLSVSTKPLPGWDVSLTRGPLPKPVTVDGTTITKAVRSVTWTARPGTRIGPDEYQQFDLSVGPLPSPGLVVLPATQTMSDGSVVRWDQPTPASGVEPEHPAPSFTVTAAAAGSGHDGGQAMSTDAAAGTSPASADPLARTLGGVAVVLGLVAVAVAVLGRRRTGTGRRS
ncbi:YcnI family protein [Terrabacter sp. NPDC080008]|uniref:YcnI family copper-binding membrane protein n=1 Tax=Terrabacter sp. NPDC080008 TaxID=3155176 RepID=UPI00344D6076